MAIFVLIIILIHAIVGWALCGLSMAVGMNTTSITNALIIHAIAAPIIYYFVSMLYFKKFNYTTPIQTAIIFVAIVILLDVFVVALLINQSFDMFLSPLGTWIPFLLIFLSTVLTGSYYTQRSIFKKG